jgi:hypothetical protein
MRFAFGTTRLVLLIGKKAIKIGRVRPLRFLARIILLPFSQKRREHFFIKYGRTLLLGKHNFVATQTAA